MSGVMRSGAKAVSGAPAVLDRPITASSAWRADGLTADDWILKIPPKALAELDELAGKLASYEGPVEDLSATDYALEAVRELMAAVDDRLHHGIGFVVLDRLPVERWGIAAARAIGWMLTSLLGPVVEQKADGTRLYEVKDSGAKLGYGVRRSVTNLDQDFHTDGGWLAQTPAIVTLVCLRPASAGGLSRVASLARAHDELRERHPDLLERLYQPFWWDRQAEHAPDECKSSRHPVFTLCDGQLTVRHYADYVHKGYALLGESLDDDGAAALRTMKAIVAAPENRIEFHLEPGQIEYVNNHLLAHARTAFEDDATRGGRYLLRLWNRRQGGIELEPQQGASDEAETVPASRAAESQGAGD
ncbi:TauD/TfdA family dioxygenase [Denitrobaculum tricleocarpae]|uniref:TauD/TfdA family dioxygenase n=1 Tax=Denitrobaculum tricleocarpae TaxID=2591009 RepID=A0A545TGI4_9PROT|nr:TauD/TfdA family dioxygenase [Denitrobaculum tricleocarpae]